MDRKNYPNNQTKMDLTLSEVPLTLLIIGIIPMLIIPQFTAFLQERILNSQTEVFDNIPTHEGGAFGGDKHIKTICVK